MSSTGIRKLHASFGTHTECELVENERYSTLLTRSGHGFSAFDDYLLTTWRADPIEGNCGLLVFLRDLESGSVWTACGRHMPDQQPGELFRERGSVAIVRSHAGISTRVDVRVLPVAGIEQRTLVVTNSGRTARHIEITTFVEIALNRAAAHDSHPAFSKLFIQTHRPCNGPILAATRRPRDRGDHPPVLMHGLFDAPVTDATTDRAVFIGRGRDLSAPHALTSSDPLGNAQGNVLDPAFSLRCVLRIEPGTARSVRVFLAAGDDADVLLGQLEGLRRASRDAEADGPSRETQRRESAAVAPAPIENPPSPDLQFFNGYGGFSADGREYVLRVTRNANGHCSLPPAPWTNVIANPAFGCIVSETGAGTTWSRNSREHRLTPWSNDPIVDPHGDALYVRDLEAGAYWSPLPGPAPAHTEYEVRHGFGYSAWSCKHDALAHEVTMFVAAEDAVRLSRVRIRNHGSRNRRLAVYAYNQWVLGTTPDNTRSTLQLEYSTAAEAVLARNPSQPQGLRGVSFAAASPAPLNGWCADRSAFLGVPGSVRAPAALSGDGRLAPAIGDPCAVLCVHLDLAPGQTGDVTFLLGDADSAEHVIDLLEKYRQPGHIDAVFQEARAAWTEMFSRLQIETPSKALDLMVNGWLPYQDVSCRMWARSAFYQAGGAFGFRDQIQDAAALVYVRPDLTRAQILLHAGHQFVEGDVLHWWHPPHSRGLRTRFADDLLWLPWATAHYIRVTGDRKVLDEPVPYIEARALRPNEVEAFVTPHRSAESGDLYEHCCRAIDRSLATGAHGLPFFGCGDWNDGMNRVGAGGRGESVWMGFFLFDVLGSFLDCCELRGDTPRCERYRQHRERLYQALNADGWDGSWYRRGWYDNGAVLGSLESDECRIDALAQAWAAISGAAPPERIARALDSVEQFLVDDEEQLIRLLTPPFENTPNDPGYIKGYVAGVRENGGQYTHAAIWVVRAMAEAGRRDRAAQLLEALLPVNHSLDRAAAGKYKVEPYVVAADVYGAPPHVGRGGWTWYTGSAGWMYRVAVETILGFTIENGDTLCLTPRIPDTWPGFRLSYRREDGTRMEIDVRNPIRCAARIISARLDGEPIEPRDGVLRAPLKATQRSHALEVVLGK